MVHIGNKPTHDQDNPDKCAMRVKPSRAERLIERRSGLLKRNPAVELKEVMPHADLHVVASLDAWQSPARYSAR